MEEKRSSVRHRVLKGAHAAFNDGRSTISCVVRNLSEEGALLRFTSVLGVPDQFVLAFDDGPRRDCKVLRRSPTELAVEFLQRAPASATTQLT